MALLFECSLDKRKRITVPHATRDLIKEINGIDLEEGDIIRGEILEVIKKQDK